MSTLKLPQLTLLLLLLLLQLLSSVQAQKTTHFVTTAPCVATQTCQPFTDATVWDDPNALTNTSQYNFIVDLTGVSGTLNLHVNSNVSVASFVCTGTHNSPLAFNTSASLTASGPIVFNVLPVSLGGISYLAAPLINITLGATLIMGDNSRIASMTTDDDTITIGDGSAFMMYHQAELYALSITSTGAISLNDQALVFVLNTATLASTLMDSTAKATFNNLYINGGVTLLGTTIVQYLYLQPQAQLLVANLNSASVELQTESNITINGVATVRYLGAPQDPSLSRIIIDKNSHFTIGGLNSQTITTQFLIGNGNNTLIVYNATLTAINTTEPYNLIDTFVLETGGFVTFANWFGFNGLVRVLPQAILDVPHHLSPLLCIEAYGQVFIHRNLTCEQGNYIQLPSPGSSLNLVDNAYILVWKLFNNASIVVHSSGIIKGNVYSNGSLEILPDQWLNIVGYIDFIGSNALLQIDGIGPNTPHYALTVRDGITMNGTFKYNVSAPQLNDEDDQTYKLISTQIDFYGNFTQIIADPSLSHFTTLLYQEEAYSIELFMKGLGHHGEGTKDVVILLAVMVPLLVISIVLTFIFINYRKNKQYRFYTRIQ